MEVLPAAQRGLPTSKFLHPLVEMVNESVAAASLRAIVYERQVHACTAPDEGQATAAHTRGGSAAATAQPGRTFFRTGAAGAIGSTP